mmetsp:Transcript_47837/g.76668  ORF Transcript_47837/g.76668 Transcript_47837/m.76668 type:complete len:238 (-) Transcript_47837:369-1082(-)
MLHAVYVVHGQLRVLPDDGVVLFAFQLIEQRHMQCLVEIVLDSARDLQHNVAIVASLNGILFEVSEYLTNPRLSAARQSNQHALLCDVLPICDQPALQRPRQFDLQRLLRCLLLAVLQVATPILLVIIAFMRPAICCVFIVLVLLLWVLVGMLTLFFFIAPFLASPPRAFASVVFLFLFLVVVLLDVFIFVFVLLWLCVALLFLVSGVELPALALAAGRRLAWWPHLAFLGGGGGRR